jgi:hypothetical protein
MFFSVETTAKRNGIRKFRDAILTGFRDVIVKTDEL